MTEECRAELKKGAAEKAYDVSLLLTTDSRPDLEACIPVTNFSSCDTLFRVTALVLRFVRNLKIKAKILQDGTVWQGEITEAEVANAETQWLRSVQKNLKSQAN